MKVRATISFSGLISMYAGEVREVEDSYILNDLMKAGYVVPAEAEAEAESRNPQTNSDSEGEGVLLEGTLDRGIGRNDSSGTESIGKADGLG